MTDRTLVATPDPDESNRPFWTMRGNPVNVVNVSVTSSSLLTRAACCQGSSATVTFLGAPPGWVRFGDE